MLFGFFCEYSATLCALKLKQKDHLKSKNHAAKKEAQKPKYSFSDAPSTGQQMALGTVVKLRGLQAEFHVENYFSLSYPFNCILTFIETDFVIKYILKRN